MRRIKAALDPMTLLNPDKIIPLPHAAYLSGEN
jgi:FAD/FMN-containing dehydrogenase